MFDRLKRLRRQDRYSYTSVQWYTAWSVLPYCYQDQNCFCLHVSWYVSLERREKLERWATSVPYLVKCVGKICIEQLSKRHHCSRVNLPSWGILTAIASIHVWSGSFKFFPQKATFLKWVSSGISTYRLFCLLKHFLVRNDVESFYRWKTE